MPLESRSLRFSTDRNVELHCLVWSKTDSAPSDSDTPLVLLHGGGANAHWWDHLAPSLCSDRSVYALDFRGHGDSEHPQEREVGAFNLDLEALLARLGRDDVDLVGHSLGAAVALDHASRFPATRSITLIDPARGGTPGSGRRARLALALRRTYVSRAEAIDRFRFLPESSHASEQLRTHIAQHSIREEPDGRFGYKFDPAWFGLPSRPRPDPSRITCPTLVIRGAESGLLSIEGAKALVRALPGGRLEEIAKAGHHVFLDQPERTCTRIREFLEDNRSPTLVPRSDPA